MNRDDSPALGKNACSRSLVVSKHMKGLAGETVSAGRIPSANQLRIDGASMLLLFPNIHVHRRKLPECRTISVLFSPDIHT